MRGAVILSGAYVMRHLTDTIVEFGEHDENALAQIRDVGSRAVRAALLADGHGGYIMPIGGVAAYRNAVSIPGVGVDQNCGNCAVKTDIQVDPDIDVREADRQVGEERARGVTAFAPDAHRTWGELADEIQRSIGFGMGAKNPTKGAPVDHPLFEHPAWEALPAEVNVHNLKGQARSQLGSVGAGNHYVDVFVGRDGYLWVGVHCGSRNLGYTIGNGFWNLFHNRPWNQGGAMTAEALLDLDTELGNAYWTLLEEVTKPYAYAGREWIVRYVAENILGGKVTDLVHNHHNSAFRETHFGEELIVVRKGATPAFPGQRGFVGGSMGDNAVILQGAEQHTGDLDDDRLVLLQQAALYSTVHGAGRVMSRGEARRTISRDEMDAWLKDKGIILRGGDLDESPQSYRRLDEVLAAQGPTIEVLEVLHPLIVVMATGGNRRR